jgi:NAD(P)-dependent dehydrogenase (short-subunit alcohol dehydrogenase family)
MKSQKTIAELIDLRGKTALVTGAASGIGKATAIRLAEAGSNLILIDIDQQSLDELSHSLKSNRTIVDCYPFDLSEKKNIDNFWESIDGTKVDILINNAGIYPFKNFMDLDYAYLEKVMQVNLYSVLWMCQNMIHYRKKKGGVIINFGSIEAILPFKIDLTQYSLSKIGVIALTRDLAREFACKGFRINGILPGGIISNGTKAAAISVLTRLQLGLISDGYNFIQRVPARRLGDPDEVARVVLMLSSDMSSYMHGAMIPVDGGFLSS